MTQSKQALVVEGGAMRGIFAVGVLDAWMAEDYRPWDFCLGVSVGSTNVAAYLAHQPGRNRKVICDYSCRPEFMDFKRFVRGGHWLDLDWLWRITIDEIRLDLDAFSAQPIPLYVVTTDAETGLPHYIEGNEDNLEELLKASCALPIAYRHTPRVNGIDMADGGVADAIPVIKAYEMGAREITVILSHPLGYRKKPGSMPRLTRYLLRQHPQLAEALIHRDQGYNTALDFIQSPPAGCTVRVIAPQPDFAVSRMTRDQEKLEHGYQMGLAAAFDA